jgi:hypothetical protein
MVTVAVVKLCFLLYHYFFPVKETQMLILRKPKILPETVSYKVPPLLNNVYRLDSIPATPPDLLNPLPCTPNKRRTHRFAPTTLRMSGAILPSHTPAWVIGLLSTGINFDFCHISA